MNIVAMIPARGGSKGVRDKNILPVGGKPLIVHTIEAANSSKLLSKVLVSTDSSAICDIACANGIEVPFMRPEELANDKTCMVDVMKHCVDWLQANQDYKTDLLVTLYPTSPFRTGDQIDKAIELFIESSADCLVSVSKKKHHPFWTLQIDENGRLCHYFPKGKHLYRRQDMPDTFDQNGAIYIVPPENIPKLDKRSMTEYTLPFIMEGKSGLNIDDAMDFLLANALAEQIT